MTQDTLFSPFGKNILFRCVNRELSMVLSCIENIFC